MPPAVKHKGKEKEQTFCWSCTAGLQTINSSLTVY